MGIQGTKGIWGEETTFLPPDFGFSNFFPSPPLSPFYAADCDLDLGTKIGKAFPTLPPSPPFWPSWPDGCAHVHCSVDMEIFNDLLERFENLTELETQQSLLIADLTQQISDLIHEVADQGDQIDDLLLGNQTLVAEIQTLEGQVTDLQETLDGFINPPPPPPPPPPTDIYEHTVHIVPTALNAALDPSATDGNDHMLVGTGIPSTSFNVQHNTLADIEGALNINYRQGDVISAYSVDGDGVLNFYVPTGPQVVDPAHGVPSANANRAAWNMNFSVDALGGHTLNEYDVHLNFDLDPSAAINYLDLHLVPLPTGVNSSESGYMWVNFATGQPVIADGGGVFDQVDQNSFNWAFIASQIDSNPSLAGIQPYAFGEGTFDIELAATESHEHTIPLPGGSTAILHSEDTLIDLHAQVHVVPPTDFHLV